MGLAQEYSELQQKAKQLEAIKASQRKWRAKNPNKVKAIARAGYARRKERQMTEQPFSTATSQKPP